MKSLRGSCLKDLASWLKSYVNVLKRSNFGRQITEEGEKVLLSLVFFSADPPCPWKENEGYKFKGSQTDCKICLQSLGTLGQFHTLPRPRWQHHWSPHYLNPQILWHGNTQVLVRLARNQTH